MVIIITDMEKLPETCAECSFKACKRPRRRNGQIRRPYFKRRHQFCELAELRPLGTEAPETAEADKHNT